MNKNIYYKQTGLFDPEQFGNTPINVYGCGSIGSNVILALAKMGFKNIAVYDFDKVEEDNLPAQMFLNEHVGMSKIEAIQDLVKKSTNLEEIYIESVKIDNDFTPDYTLNSFHILCFDNIESRKLLAEKLKRFKLNVIDGRIGAFNYEIYSVDFFDKKAYQKYIQTFENEFAGLKCNEKCLFPVNTMIAAKICAEMLNVLYKKEYNSYKGNLLSNIIIKECQNE